jgi:hypothetical protein
MQSAAAIAQTHTTAVHPLSRLAHLPELHQVARLHRNYFAVIEHRAGTDCRQPPAEEPYRVRTIQSVFAPTSDTRACPGSAETAVRGEGMKLGFLEVR